MNSRRSDGFVLSTGERPNEWNDTVRIYRFSGHGEVILTTFMSAVWNIEVSGG